MSNVSLVVVVVVVVFFKYSVYIALCFVGKLIDLSQLKCKCRGALVIWPPRSR